jgi:hypothetical protein
VSLPVSIFFPESSQVFVTGLYFLFLSPHMQNSSVKVAVLPTAKSKNDFVFQVISYLC